MKTKKTEFKIVVFAKKIIFHFSTCLDNVPNRERVLRDNVNKKCFELLENIYLTNNLDKYKYSRERIYIESKILSCISMLDFYLEVLYDKKYIGEKKSVEMSRELEKIREYVRGWVRSEKSDN